MSRIEPPPVPEHEKMKSYRAKIDHVAEFLEYLQENGFEICRRPTEEEIDSISNFYEEEKREPNQMLDFIDAFNLTLRAVKAETLKEWAFFPTRKRIEDWLGEFTDIDQKKLDAEKDALLAYQRRLNKEIVRD